LNTEAAVRRFYEAFNAGDPSILDRALAPEWEEIPRSFPGQGPGREGFKPVVAGFRSVLPDLAFTNEDVLVAGGKVAVRSTIRGTHRGEFMGIPPTGRRVEYAAFDIHLLEDGLIARTWHLEDFFGLLRQLGATFALDGEGRGRSS